MNRGFYCKCKQCKKAKKKGLILGSCWQMSWKHGLMIISDYVPFFRFAKGRRAYNRKKMKKIDWKDWD